MKISNYVITPFRSLVLGLLAVAIVITLFVVVTGIQVCIEKTVRDGLQSTISDISHIENKKSESKK